MSQIIGTLAKLRKRAVDARNKNDVLLVFTFDVSIEKKHMSKAANQPFVIKT
jgi:hypothetical protein